MLPVTIIIPTYNGTRHIAEALRSVFAQTLLPNEVIVVDDHSTDDTLEIVLEVACGAPVPVQILRLPRNSGGPARPINTGIASARTELIAILDQDDTFAPEKIESQARALTENSNLALAAGFCGLPHNTEPQRHLKWQLEVFHQLGGDLSVGGSVFLGRDVLRVLVAGNNFLIGYPGFMFRKTHWRAKGGVDEHLPVASDYDLLCWLCARGDVFLDPAVHYVRREHDENVSNNAQKTYLDCARVRGRYLVSQRWLLEDRATDEWLRNWFLAFAYWLREAGNYRGAWECYRLAALVWGWNWSLLRVACKLPFHLLWRDFMKTPPVYNELTRLTSKRATIG